MGDGAPHRRRPRPSRGPRPARRARRRRGRRRADPSPAPRPHRVPSPRPRGAGAARPAATTRKRTSSHVSSQIHAFIKAMYAPNNTRLSRGPGTRAGDKPRRSRYNSASFSEPHNESHNKNNNPPPKKTKRKRNTNEDNNANDHKDDRIKPIAARTQRPG